MKCQKHYSKNHEKIKPNRISQKFNGDNKTELIKLDKNLFLKNVINILTDMNKVIDTIIETQILKKHNVDILNYTQVQTNKEQNLMKNKKKQNVQENMNDDIIKEYFETCTLFSNNISDSIKMNELYSRFVEWVKNKYPEYCIPGTSSGFTRIFKKLNIGIYKSRISNLNGNSGLSNRKFKVV